MVADADRFKAKDEKERAENRKQLADKEKADDEKYFRMKRTGH
jgi:hypothetical protein